MNSLRRFDTMENLFVSFKMEANDDDASKEMVLKEHANKKRRPNVTSNTWSCRNKPSKAKINEA